MNKSELVAAMASQADISKKDAEAALKAFTDVVAKQLKKGQKVQTKQKAAPAPKAPEEPVIRNITLPASLTLKELADKIKQPVNAMIKKLFMEGMISGGIKG